MILGMEFSFILFSSSILSAKLSLSLISKDVSGSNDVLIQYSNTWSMCHIHDIEGLIRKSVASILDPMPMFRKFNIVI